LCLALILASAQPTFAFDRQIYPPVARAHTDLAAGLKSAAATHKHVILDFGGDWCGDCQVLDIYFHDVGNRPILDANYVLVHINVGHRDENVQLAERYGVNLAKGVPALVVLDEHGRLLYSQRTGEFAPMHRLDPGVVTSFLIQWKPVRPSK
jgi:thiol:disulfide interchange protein